jgi:hypothetical protein
MIGGGVGMAVRVTFYSDGIELTGYVGQTEVSKWRSST